MENNGIVTPTDALYEFGAWLTTRTEQAGPFSAHDDAAPMVQLIKQFCDEHGLSPDVSDAWLNSKRDK